MYGLAKTKILHCEPFLVISMQIGGLREHLAREVHQTPHVLTFILDPM